MVRVNGVLKMTKISLKYKGRENIGSVPTESRLNIFPFAFFNTGRCVGGHRVK